MAKLRLVLEIDVNPTLEDPMEVAAAIVDDIYEENTYSNKAVEVLEALWGE